MLFWMAFQSFGQLSTYIPSEVAGDTGLAVKIVLPDSNRYGDYGAPIVVDLRGGDFADGISENELKEITDYGFILIKFNYPGGVSEDLKSGGTYDHRGDESLQALVDVLKFAAGKKKDKNKKKLDELIDDPIKPAYAILGMVGRSGGGNTALAVCGRYGNQIQDVKFLFNWESPVGDPMVTHEQGSRISGINPRPNPAYDPTTGVFNYHLLKYDPYIDIARDDETVLLGGFYYDIDQDDTCDIGSDFISYPFVYEQGNDTFAYYNLHVLRYAEDTLKIYPQDAPSHLRTFQQSRNFWEFRNGELFYDLIIEKMPHLMFMAGATQRDHGVSTKDHPHILNQCEGLRKKGLHFVRLNPDKSYLDYVYGMDIPIASDNDANMPLYRSTIHDKTQRVDTLVTGKYIKVAAVCELADRAFTKDYSVNLHKVIDYQHWSPPTSVSTLDLPEVKLIPNPADRQVQLTSADLIDVTGV